MTKYIVEIDETKKKDLLYFLEFVKRNHFKVTEMEGEEKVDLYQGLKSAIDQVKADQRGEINLMTAEDLLNSIDEDDE